jgi:hypothetical protein
MLQNITVEMLAELTPAEQQRLRDWWKPQEFDVILASKYGKAYPVVDLIDAKGLIGYIGDGWCDNDYCTKQECLPCLSIGQCIQLLSDYEPYKSNHIIIYVFPETKLAYAFDSDTSLQNWAYSGSGNEPIRALWDAVKACLKEATAEAKQVDYGLEWVKFKIGQGNL